MATALFTEPPRSETDEVTADDASPRGARRRRVLFGLVFTLILTLVVDLIMTLTLCRHGWFLRWPLPPYSLVFTEHQALELDRLADKADLYGCFDPDLGWSHRASAATPDGAYRTNRAGARSSREYTPTPRPGVTRIAAFGDSYTHGHTVANEQVWTHILEQSREDLEVLNFGVNGYGTDQAFLRYQHNGREWQPHIVLIGLMVENILRNVSVYRPAYYHECAGVPVKPRFRLARDGALELVATPARSTAELKELIQSGRLLDTLQRTDYWVQRAPKAYDDSLLFPSSFVRIGYAGYENWGRTQSHYYRDPDNEPFRVTRQILKEFHDSAIEDGAQRVYVLIFPDAETVEQHAGGRPAYWWTMVEAMRESSIPVIDLTPPLVRALRSHGSQALFNGNHYSAKGNAVVAEVLASELFRD